MRAPVCCCCDSATVHFASAIVLNRLEVNYFRCVQCGLVRTEEPTWLAEAYSRPIAAMDVGLLQRSLVLADVTELVVRFLPPNSRGLDWAGGYGVLTRLLRDRGILFHHHDPYTESIFADGLQGNPREQWRIITLFEVFEHLSNPMGDLVPLCMSSPVLLFTTELLPDPAPGPNEWWYYTLESGQHVTFYTIDSLAALAERLGMQFITDGKNVHAFYRRGALPRRARAAIRHHRRARLLLPLLRRSRPIDSLLQRDFELARASVTTRRESIGETPPSVGLDLE